MSAVIVDGTVWNMLGYVNPGFGGGGVTPLTLLADLWLDGADADAVTIAIDPAASHWLDKSGNDYDFIQLATAGEQPDYVDDGSGNFGLEFDVTTSENLAGLATYNKIDNIFDGDGYMVFVANHDTADTGTVRSLYTKNGFVQFSLRRTDGKIQFNQFFDGDNGIWQTTAAEIPVGINIIELQYDSDLTTNDPIMTVNGAVVGVSEITTPTGTRNDDSTSVPGIGGFLTANTFNGAIHEVAAWTAVPSAADRTSLREALAAKWGVTLV